MRRLLEMREEIAALRDELHRTTQASSKPATATTIATVDSSVMVEVSVCSVLSLSVESDDEFSLTL